MEAVAANMMTWVCGLMQDAAGSMPGEAISAATQSAEGAAEHPSLVQQMGLCIVAATLLGFIARMVKQPLLLAYIGAGVLIGPIGLKLIKDREMILSLAELGLAFLMFIVGLEIDIKKLLSAGTKAAIATTVQVTGCGLMGWATATVMGYGGMSAVYIGVAMMFSSTMIVVKLLGDKGELDTLPGRMTLAILLLQDVIAIMALAIQPNLGSAAALGPIAWSILKGIGLAVGAVLVARWVLPRILRWVEQQPELLLLTAVTWCLLVCYAAVQLEFSLAMGALIAGVSISSLPYTMDVVAKINSLRDFFVTLFFVSLGMLLEAPSLGMVVAAVVLSIAVVISRFLFVWPVLRMVNFDNRTGVLCSIHLAQVGEFGLVMALLGVQKFGHIGQETVSLIILALVITASMTTYLVEYSHVIAGKITRNLKATVYGDDHGEGTNWHGGAEVMLIGCHRTGISLVRELMTKKRDFCVVDFNTELHERLKAFGVKCLYGDIGHQDVLEHAGLENAKVLVCSVSDDFLRGTNNRHLLEGLRKAAPHAKVVVTAESPGDARSLYELGADHVLVPRELGARELMAVIDLALGGKLGSRREREMDRLRKAMEIDSGSEDTGGMDSPPSAQNG